MRFRVHQFCEDPTNENYGLALVRYALEARGHQFVESGEDTDLISFYWPEQMYDLIRWKRNGWNGKSKIIIGGNSATVNPAVCFPWADYAYIGDGELWDGSLDHQALVQKGCGPVPILRAERVYPIPFRYKQKRPNIYVELSRGCKNKCAFCQYGWLKPYRESSFVDVKGILDASPTKHVRVISADRFQYREYDAFRRLLDAQGKVETGADISLRHIIRNPESLKITPRLRIGVEGMSERLRNAVLKPIADQELIDVHRAAHEYGIKSIDWYMIYGLPWETDADADAFIQLLCAMGKEIPGATMGIHFNAFQPNALTPMQWDAPAVDYPAQRLDRIMNTKIPGLRIAYTPRGTTSNARMAQRMAIVRGSEHTSQLSYGIAYTAKLRSSHSQIARHYERLTGRDCLASWALGSEMPWDAYVQYDRDKLARVRKACDIAVQRKVAATN